MAEDGVWLSRKQRRQFHQPRLRLRPPRRGRNMSLHRHAAWASRCISTAHYLCWTDSFVNAVAKDAITGIINVVQGRLPHFVVNFEATTHPRVRAWSSAA